MHRSESIDVEVRELAPGVKVDLPIDDRERAIVVLRGTCAACFAEGPRWEGLGGRTDVFDGKATALYAPRSQGCRIEAGGSGVAVAIVSTPVTTAREPFVVRPEELHIEQRGQGTWSREVHDIIGAGHGAERLLVGETFCDEGVWSGYPPHRHQFDDPPHESRFDEVFLIRVRPATGFGVLVRYGTEGEREQATIVRDGDFVSVSDGFHSFVAAAGHRFYYLWALAGRERVLRSRTDGRYGWLESVVAR